MVWGGGGGGMVVRAVWDLGSRFYGFGGEARSKQPRFQALSNKTRRHLEGLKACNS